MSDLNPRDTLERELARHLAPVTAPETLWDDFAKAGRASAQSRRRSIAWNPGNKMILSPALVLLLLTVAAGAVWKSDQPRALRSDAPAKLSAGRSGVRANPAGNPLSNPAITNQFSDACVMCHTGATLYVSTGVE